MKVIYKYPFELTDVVRIVMPSDAKVLYVHDQLGQPCMWAIHDAHAVPDTEFVFRLFGTGDTIDNERTLTYIGTFFTHYSRGIWHVFEMPAFRTAAAASQVQQLECA